MAHRRSFLKFLASSPLLAGAPALAASLLRDPGDALLAAVEQITDPRDVLNVFEMEALARRTLPPAHWGYLAGAVDDDLILQANRDGFRDWQLNVRRFIDVSNIDTSVELFGHTWSSPIGLCPIGSAGAFHADGELEVARATRGRDILQIHSTQSSKPIEEVIETRGEPVWYQLYTTSSRDVTRQLVRRAESAGCEVVAVTVSVPAGRNAETQTRFRRLDDRDCSVCHTGQAKPMFEGIDMRGVGLTDASLTWDFIRALKDMTSMRVVIKGLENREDAELAVEHGADGIVVSNHGGRSIETGRGTIVSLPEVVAGANGRVPVLIDGGFRRGTDIFKALALGADAVCIGRPYIWGLSAFGEAGVGRVLDLLRRELVLAMTQCGTRTIGEIGPETLHRA